jgi:hypothetical protein
MLQNDIKLAGVAVRELSKMLPRSAAVQHDQTESSQAP